MKQTKKKSMQRSKPSLKSSVSNKPHKNVSINITVEGDNQALDNKLSQKQDIKYQQPIQQPKTIQEKPDEGLKEQLADAIRRLDQVNDMATKQGIDLPNRLQVIPQNILDVRSSQDIRTLISYILNMISQIQKMTTAQQVRTPTLIPQAGPSTFQPSQQVRTPTLKPQAGPSTFQPSQQGRTPSLTQQQGQSEFQPPEQGESPSLIEGQEQTESQAPTQATIQDLNAYQKSLEEYFSSPSEETLQNLSSAVKPLNNDPNFDAVFTTQSFFQSKGVNALTNFLKNRGMLASDAQQMSKSDKIANILNTLKENDILAQPTTGGGDPPIRRSDGSRGLLSTPISQVIQNNQRRKLGLPDYERQGDALRDLTVQNAQVALQRGDLPVLNKALTGVIQAQNTLSQYILLEPRNDYDAMIRTQILDLDTYKDKLETAIKEVQTRQAQQQPAPDDKPGDEVIPIDDKPSDDKPSDDKPSDDKPSDDKPSDDKPGDEVIPIEEEYKNKFGKFIDFKINRLRSFQAPQTTRQQSINADKIIKSRINTALQTLNLALEKPDLTVDEFDTAMTPLPIDVIGSWGPTRALVILKGESMIPSRYDKVELRPVPTPEGSRQLYKLFFNGTELTKESTEIFFTENGDLFTQQDIDGPPETEPEPEPDMPISIERKNQLSRWRYNLYSTPYTPRDIVDYINYEISKAFLDPNEVILLDRSNGNITGSIAYLNLPVKPVGQDDIFSLTLAPKDDRSPIFNLRINGELAIDDRERIPYEFNDVGDLYNESIDDYMNFIQPVLTFPFRPTSEDEYKEPTRGKDDL